MNAIIGSGVDGTMNRLVERTSKVNGVILVVNHAAIGDVKLAASKLGLPVNVAVYEEFNPLVSTKDIFVLNPLDILERLMKKRPVCFSQDVDDVQVILFDDDWDCDTDMIEFLEDDDE